VLLLSLNLVRLGALLLTGVYRPTLFDSMHLEILPGFFLIFALFLWICWALWVRRPKSV